MVNGYSGFSVNVWQLNHFLKAVDTCFSNVSQSGYLFTCMQDFNNLWLIEIVLVTTMSFFACVLFDTQKKSLHNLKYVDRSKCFHWSFELKTFFFWYKILTAIVFFKVAGDIFWQHRHLLVQHLPELVHCHSSNTPIIGLITFMPKFSI